MAKLPTIKSLRREDIPDAPEWMTPMFTQLNSFMSSMYYALDKDLTFNDNIASSVKQISFITRSDYLTATPLSGGFEVQKIYNPLKVKPVGVILVKATDLTAYSIITSAISINWSFLDSYININYVTGLVPSNKYELNLLII